VKLVKKYHPDANPDRSALQRS